MWKQQEDLIQWIMYPQKKKKIAIIFSTEAIKYNIFLIYSVSSIYFVFSLVIKYLQNAQMFQCN